MITAKLCQSTLLGEILKSVYSVNQTKPINLLLRHGVEFFIVTDDDRSYITSYHWALKGTVNNTFPCKRYKYYT